MASSPEFESNRSVVTILNDDGLDGL